MKDAAAPTTTIHSLSFDEIGMPVLAEDGLLINPIGPVCHWNYANAENIYEQTKIGQSPNLQTSYGFMMQSVAKSYKFDRDYDVSELGLKKEGRRLILNRMCAQPPFTNPDGKTPETFTIHHNGLDLQNILVDDDGNVTSIIDWDYSFVGPVA
ncbi:hypothetical protein E8E11_007592 [Didymella keratinophila]|nr:hypothetical protein E8E11_007592 [Didymella keratinophila]